MVRFLHFNFFHFPIVTWPTLFFSNFKRKFSFLISKIKIFKFSWHISIFSFPYGGMPIFLKFQFKFKIDFSNFPFHMAYFFSKFKKNSIQISKMIFKRIFLVP
jgi:hypothetical protein